MDSASKTDTVFGPPPGDRAGSRAGQDAEGCAFGGRRRGEQGHHRLYQGGFGERRNRESLLPRGEEDRFRKPGGQGLEAGEEIFTRGSCVRGGPGRTISPKESALQRAVSRKKGGSVIRDIPIFASEDNRSFYLVVRISVLLR